MRIVTARSPIYGIGFFILPPWIGGPGRSLSIRFGPWHITFRRT